MVLFFVFSVEKVKIANYKNMFGGIPEVVKILSCRSNLETGL